MFFDRFNYVTPAQAGAQVAAHAEHMENDAPAYAGVTSGEGRHSAPSLVAHSIF
jgi:hypothetical protein